MPHAEDWIRALEQADAPTRFSLSFARLGLTAECRSLSAGEISRAVELSGEAAARQLLYLACPSLQQAGEAMAAAGTIVQPVDITWKLPYSDVLQAASLILRHSGGGAGMVSVVPAGMQPEESLSEEVDLQGLTALAREEAQLDGYALLQQWAAEDRSADSRAVSGEGHDALSETRRLRQAWTGEAAPWHPAETHAGAVTAEQVAWELCRRLRDAAGNM